VRATAPACLHDADATDVSHLTGDARKIEVCFAEKACFAIDRRRGAIVRFQPPSAPRAVRAPHRVQPISFAWVNKDVARVCVGATCTNVTDPRAAELAGGRADVNTLNGAMLVTVGADGVSPAHFFRVYSGGLMMETKIDVVAPCADANWLDDDILVTSDDCNGGTPIGVVYDFKGRSLFQVGLGRAIDTHDATLVRGGSTLAIIAPHAYALVLVESSTRQQVVDLVPIQAEATPSPHFEAASLDDRDWVVASATGGVGIYDHHTATLTKTWLLPRCEASQ
jgi:hypothetical protein